MTNSLTAVRRLLSEEELRRIFLAAILTIAIVLGVQAQAQESAFYIVKQPIVRTIALNKWALATIVAYQFANTATVLYMGSLGGPAAFSAVLAKEAVQYAQFPLVTSGLLKNFANDEWKILLNEVVKKPGVQDARMFTTSDVSFKGPFADQVMGQGYLVVQAKGDLNQNAEFVQTFGESIRIHDLKSTYVTFTFNDGVTHHPKMWTTTMEDVLEQGRFPLEVVQAWRSHVKQLGKDQSSWNRNVSHQYMDTMKVEALIVLPTGEGVPLGPVASGSGMTKLLAMTLSQRLTRAMWPAIPAGSEGEIHTHFQGQPPSKSKMCSSMVRRAISRLALEKN